MENGKLHAVMVNGHPWAMEFTASQGEERQPLSFHLCKAWSYMQSRNPKGLLALRPRSALNW
eukprot:5426654-Karenia_brevis.AAC.1